MMASIRHIGTEAPEGHLVCTYGEDITLWAGKSMCGDLFGYETRVMVYACAVFPVLTTIYFSPSSVLPPCLSPRTGNEHSI
jgi:hypothetical protein